MDERCGYTKHIGLWAPLTCGCQKGHTGVHIDFRPNISIGFGAKVLTPKSQSARVNR